MNPVTLTLSRKSSSKLCTLGNLRITGRDHDLCTLEPQGTDTQAKPRCIPAGTYSVTLRMSPRFGYVTPYLHDVPDFEDILIHSGNYPQDTEGCILVGESTDGEAIDNSRKAFHELMDILKDSIEITITILDVV